MSEYVELPVGLIELDVNNRPIEQAKIACSKQLFNSISPSQVRYQWLLDIIEKL